MTNKNIQGRPDFDKFAVVIPFYNVEYQWFLDCIDSVKKVASTNHSTRFLVVLVDDASPTQMPDYFEKLREEENTAVVVIRNKENRGLGGARNIALEHIPMDYVVVFLDADDLLLDIPKKMNTSIFLAGRTFFYDGSSLPRRSSAENYKIDNISSRKLHSELLIHNSLPVSSYFIERNIIGATRFREGLPACEDWGFWIDVFGKLTNEPTQITEIPFTAIRKSRNSMSSSPQKVFLGRSLVFRDLLSKDPSSIIAREIVVNSLLGKCLYEKTSLYARAHCIFNGLALFLKSAFEGKGTATHLRKLAVFAIGAGMSPQIARASLNRRYLARTVGGLNNN